MDAQLKEKITGQIAAHKIIVYMKGTKEFPQCGFSNRVVQILKVLGAPFETIDILADDAVRQGIKEYSNWPTLPQVYINGQFIGGCDIVTEMYQSGELQPLVSQTLPEAKSA